VISALVVDRKVHPLLTPSRRKMTAAGQKPVMLDWSRLKPTEMFSSR
jgi:hypothetical protein